MTLIKSISGIRGTIGGKTNNNLTPIDAVKYAAAYGQWLKNNSKNNNKLTVIIGRDARISGKMISDLVTNTLIGLGINVVDIDLSTTPTVEFAVTNLSADGGVIITASHNPKQWNALKLLNYKGEFLNAIEGDKILNLAEESDFEFAQVDDLGVYSRDKKQIKKHIKSVLDLDLVDVKAIKKAKLKVVVDAVNSTGGIAIPALLKKLKVKCIELYCTPNGEFPHNPEPLKEHLTDISELVVKEKADLGIVVDPDVDRLALVCEDGSMFGEEYTLVACADYVLSKKKGNTVSNLSSSRALKDISDKHGVDYIASAVGEVNVVEAMKTNNAVIGGEGNGGIILPDSHYGRDSLVGVALFLSKLATAKVSCKQLRDSYPSYYMSKNKIDLIENTSIDDVWAKIGDKYKDEKISLVDGLKIDFENQWVHLRKSNTEPIIRIYTESKSQKDADDLAVKFQKEIAMMS
ncbi:MAG: phosphoglucosamine mutase [Flavobacteriaceae bacterium]|nr:phosphoglucosamine mutase [Flavobacteriaceae bacterium]